VIGTLAFTVHIYFRYISTTEYVFFFTLLLLTIQPPDAGGGRSGGDGGQHQKNRRQRLRLLPRSARWSYSIHSLNDIEQGSQQETFVMKSN
jgi:hypothetical protein